MTLCRGCTESRTDKSGTASPSSRATDARRAFPCFDEPGYKVSFDLWLTVPKGMIAVANTPETARRDSAETTTFEFATTPPLPTYLAAFAVGDFDVISPRVPAGGGSRPQPPVRLIATKGKGALGDLAIETATALTRELEELLRHRLPLSEARHRGRSQLRRGGDGGNAGLITFRDTLLLLDREHASANAKERAGPRHRSRAFA